MCVYVCMETQEKEGGEEILKVHREKRETKTERERERERESICVCVCVNMSRCAARHVHVCIRKTASECAKTKRARKS